MSLLVPVYFHPSQHPDAVRRDLLHSLRSRQVNHKFHYDSVKQAHKWLALHQAYSPAETDPDCAATYDRAFADIAQRIEAQRVQIIGLGCGGGEKDVRLLRALQHAGKTVAYVAIDVSAPLTLIARQTALQTIAPQDCAAAVCDLAKTTDLDRLMDHFDMNAVRLIAFFGMIPNFEPQQILPRLASVVRPGDALLLSANLAPGADYADGVRRVLPLYDNALTADWLMTWLNDLGVDSSYGEIQFTIEEVAGLKRIVARFEFNRGLTLRIDGEVFEFARGDRIQLFFSYRHTPETLKRLLAEYSLPIVDEWISASEEEGLFLVSKS